MQRFYKGRTNNHLTWVMVDATDYASPESALSAATKIKIYGKLRGAAGVNFVSSGTGSLTNDITHVGASVLGIYSIGLAKADLSDASAAWYDQYIISLSATGAAYQMLVVEGVIDDSTMSGLISDIQSAVAVGNSRVLLTQSLASDAASAAIQANSRVLLNQSFLSDIRSHVSDLQSDFQSRVPKRVATDSQLSDLHSDLRSYLVVMSGVQSDIYSALSDFQSDFGSRVPKRVATDSQLSDLHSDLKSHLAVSSGVQSDIYSLLSDIQSDFQSRVPKLVATNSQVSDLASDLKSALAAIPTAVSASDLSDIASAVWANTIGARVDSRVLVGQSYLSDIRSHVSDLQSDFQSRVPKRVATDSQLSDLASDLKSAIGGITVTIGASDVSDIASAVVAGLPIASVVSDIYSLLSDLQSDFQSRVPKRVATDSQVSALTSDVLSAIALAATPPTPSEIADEVETRAMTLTSGERAAIAAALLDLSNAIETGVTLRGAQRLMLAALAGKLSGAAGTTVTFRNAVADSKDRIVATVDGSGNRTAITADQT